MLMFLLALFFQSPTYRLTVIGGSGSGSYTCGSKVRIVGDRSKKSEVFGQWFAGWDGDTAIDAVHQRKALLTMPCKDLTIEAKFTARHR